MILGFIRFIFRQIVLSFFKVVRAGLVDDHLIQFLLLMIVVC